ncbi:hypothetical protein DFAR_4060002 [Desulfarculales bacterium]
MHAGGRRFEPVHLHHLRVAKRPIRWVDCSHASCRVNSPAGLDVTQLRTSGYEMGR